MTVLVVFVRSATGCRMGVVVVIAGLLLAGCDKLPEQPTDEETAAAPAAAAPPPVAVRPVDPPTPEEMIDTFLAGPPNLRTDAQLQELSEIEEGLERITDLDLRNSAVSNNGVAVLPKFTGIRRLDLSGTRVSSGFVKPLVEMPSLEELVLNDLPLEDAGLTALSELPSLRSLSLAATAISDDGFAELARCEFLETLRVDDNDRLLGHVFSELLRHQEFSTLRELSVNGTAFGYHGLDELNRLSQLEVLNAANADVTDPALDGIRSCTALRKLNLSDNRLTDAALQRLTPLRGLQELDVGGCGAITDAGLRHLRGHRQLQRLSLQGTRCTVAGARDLKEKFLENTTIMVADGEL